MFVIITRYCNKYQGSYILFVGQILLPKYSQIFFSKTKIYSVQVVNRVFFFFFFKREFQYMTFAPDNVFYQQTKTPIGFWCRRRLNLKSLIQPLETLPVELTGIHNRVAFGLSDFSLFLKLLKCDKVMIFSFFIMS